jgi:hypothetical protein
MNPRRLSAITARRRVPRTSQVELFAHVASRLGELVGQGKTAGRAARAPAPPSGQPGDSMTVDRIDGQVSQPDGLLCVSRRGTYAVARCELWPSGRELLLLKAWPSR